MKKLKSGDILICKRKTGLIARLIRLATKSEWSHTALYIELNNSPMIIEAQVNGVNLKAFDNWVDKYSYEYKIMRKKSPMDVKDKAISKIGITAYDFESFIIRQPWRLLTGNYKNKGKKEEKRMICSEFTAWVYDLPNWWKSLPSTQNEYLSNSESWECINK